MCLSVPSKIHEILDDGFAIVDTMGVKRKVSLHLISEEVNIGDFVLIHVGYAITKIDQDDAFKSLELYNQIIKQMDNP